MKAAINTPLAKKSPCKTLRREDLARGAVFLTQYITFQIPPTGVLMARCSNFSLFCVERFIKRSEIDQKLRVYASDDALTNSKAVNYYQK